MLKMIEILKNFWRKIISVLEATSLSLKRRLDFQGLVQDAVKSSGKVLFLLLTSLVIVWISIFTYITVHYNFIPTTSHSRQVNFKFSPSCRIDDEFNRNYPSAKVTLSTNKHSQMMVSGQPYFIYFELDLPESEVNKNIGMFSITLNFLDRNRDLVASSTRSAMLRYKSSLHQVMSTVVFLSSLLAGISEEKQLIAITMFEDFEDNAIHQSMTAEIFIESCDIQLYSANLYIEARFSGLRYFMHYWPLTSAFIGIGMSQLFLFLVAILSWYRFLWPQQKESLGRSLNQTTNEFSSPSVESTISDETCNSEGSSIMTISENTSANLATTPSTENDFEDVSEDVQIREINSNSDNENELLRRQGFVFSTNNDV